MQLDALFTNGRFTTMDPARSTAQSLGVLDGLIAGFDDELQGCRADVVHDLDGAAVIPGLHDAHYHLSDLGQSLQRCDVSPAAVSTLQEVYVAVARHAATLPADAWVIGEGYDDSQLDGRPTREGLDAASGGRPVWMIHRSHHQGVVNTAAIRRMGYTDPRDLPDVEAGVVERGPHGEPTGLLAEEAVFMVLRVIRPVPLEEFVDAIARGCQASLAVGLTSVTQPGICGQLVGNGPDDLAAFHTARDRGLLRLRVTLMPEITTLHEVAANAGFGLDLGLRSGLGDDWLRIGGLKVFADGALSARTAALTADYAGRPGWRGLLAMDPRTTLRDRIEAAHRAGWQVCTHAIGDAVVSAVLDAYEHAQHVAPRPDPRHRIEHCGLASDDDVRRIKALGVIPVPQARFLHESGDAYLAAVGPERGERLYLQRTYLEAGIELPGSSDCPVVSGRPLGGIHALVNRTIPGGAVLNPAERLTPLQALRAYTYGSAYADHQEHRKGSLSRGKLADFVVLSEDLFAVAPAAIEQISVVATVVGGVVCYGAEHLST